MTQIILYREQSKRERGAEEKKVYYLSKSVKEALNEQV